MMKKILLLLFSPFIINAQTAFISGTHNLCDNEKDVLIEIGFIGIPPFAFVYAIDDINQSIIQNISDNPYFLSASNQGIYTITAFNDAVSVGSFNGSAIVSVLESPTAIFSADADTLSVLYPISGYNDVSLGNISTTIWIFGDDKSYHFSQTAYHVYLSDSTGLGIPAIYQDSLIVIDVNGCSDTAIHQVWIKDEYWVHIPNAFTPNLDDKNRNEKFCFEHHSIRENSFLFKVFNQKGELVFQSTDALGLSCSSIDGGWDGTYFKTQEKLSSGIYSYNLFFQEIEGWKHNKYGTIALVR
jgi:hypothetical protein